MTAVSIAVTSRFQYQGYATTWEAFVAASGGASILDVVLYGVSGYNASASDRWFQLATNINALSVPLVSIPVPAGQPFSWTPAAPGFRFKTGTASRWRISSTGNVYTAAADDFWVNAIGRAITEAPV